MQFRLADTFTDALARLPAQDQKAVKVSVMDLQIDPSGPGLQMHRITQSKDARFWSARVNRDIRLILHKTGANLLVAYVGHHEDAYAWAERRRIETHPATGAVQIVEVRELVEAAEPGLARFWQDPEPTTFGLQEAPARFVFADLTDQQLMSIGVPGDWLDPVRRTAESEFFELADHLPDEAAEALLDYAVGGAWPLQRPIDVQNVSPDFEAAPSPQREADPYQHPDARRRFVAVESAEELAAALAAPWDRWSIFLHPTQRAIVERQYGGPARVMGSAGTGKTVVALHRTARALASSVDAKVLLATFSEPLACHLDAKLKLLLAQGLDISGRVTVGSFEGVAIELFELAFGRKPRLARSDQIESVLAKAVADHELRGFSRRFISNEWDQVIDPRQVSSLEQYADAPRLGRKSRLGQRQREALWPVFETARAALIGQGLLTRPMLFNALADHFSGRPDKPFTNIVVDEAQDLGIAELRMIRALVPSDGTDRLFFAGDLGQRIFQQPFSWRELGIDLRGRSRTLTVNYRTSQQIRKAADLLLPSQVRDVDGEEADRRSTVSTFQGPEPEISLVPSMAEETRSVAAFVRRALDEGLAPQNIGVFVRSAHELPRARAAVVEAGAAPLEISDERTEADNRVSIGTMHLAKGLEFRWVAVMACDDDVLPDPRRIDAVIDQTDLEDVYDTERHLLYVSCTRARDRLLVTGVSPGSEFLQDLDAFRGKTQR